MTDAMGTDETTPLRSNAPEDVAHAAGLLLRSVVQCLTVQNAKTGHLWEITNSNFVIEGYSLRLRTTLQPMKELWVCDEAADQPEKIYQLPAPEAR